MRYGNSSLHNRKKPHVRRIRRVDIKSKRITSNIMNISIRPKSSGCLFSSVHLGLRIIKRKFNNRTMLPLLLFNVPASLIHLIAIARKSF
jgi:hypothetical protein